MPRKEKKYHYLYKTINKLNNKYYYGIHSTNNLEDGYLGSGKAFKYALRKYGKNNFLKEIIEFFDNRQLLSDAEAKLITKEMLLDKMCYNCQFGGDTFDQIGMVNVKDKNGNTFKVFTDDKRYLSGELVSANKGFLNLKDKIGNHVYVSLNDPRYLSGELFGHTKNKTSVKDNNGNKFYIDISDERYLSGELVGLTKGKVNVKDENNNIFNVDIDDPRYLSGELLTIWKNKTHKQESKDKIGKANSIKLKGKNNPSFGKIWITNKIENKMIKKEELNNYLILGWIKGRII